MEKQEFSIPKIALATFLSFMAVLFIPFIVDLFGQVGVILLGEEIKANPDMVTTLAYLPLLALIFIFLRASLEPLKNFGFFFSKDMLGISVLVGLASALCLYAIDVHFGILESFSVPADPSFSIVIGFFIAWGVLVPVFEEALFRGMIQHKFQELIKTEWKIHPAIFIASFFEVLMHLIVPLWFATRQNLVATFTGTFPQLAYVLVFGAIGGYIYYRTKSLTGPIIIHAMGNIGEVVLYWIFF